MRYTMYSSITTCILCYHECSEHISIRPNCSLRISSKPLIAISFSYQLVISASQNTYYQCHKHTHRYTTFCSLSTNMIVRYVYNTIVYSITMYDGYSTIAHLSATNAGSMDMYRACMCITEYKSHIFSIVMFQYTILAICIELSNCNALFSSCLTLFVPYSYCTSLYAC